MRIMARQINTHGMGLVCDISSVELDERDFWARTEHLRPLHFNTDCRHDENSSHPRCLPFCDCTRIGQQNTSHTSSHGFS